MDHLATTPRLVRAPRDADTLEIEWADGHVSRYANAFLRGYCPCAGCQGHSGEIRFLPGSNADLENIEEVGNYGLSFTWGDGHNSGIYTYHYLRRICGCDRCLPGSAHARHEPLPR
jgi:DUF971 family protein